MKLILSILLFTTLTAFVNSCSKSGNKFREGAIELKLSGCENGNIAGDDLKLCFNKVVSDSRCPATQCVFGKVPLPLLFLLLKMVIAIDLIFQQ